jgi:hypothetical protein
VRDGTLSLDRIREGRGDFQQILLVATAPLTAEQVALWSAAHLGSVGKIAATSS